MTAIPTPGSIVEVTTRYRTHYYYATEPFVEYHYRGTVLPSEKWFAPTAFAIHDGQMRVIDVGNVKSLRVIEGSVEEVATAPKVVLIQGSKGDVYSVVFERGKWTCTCSGFQFRKMCKHVTEASKS